MDNESCSDLRIISFTISMNRNLPFDTFNRTIKFNFERANWPFFREILHAFFYNLLSYFKPNIDPTTIQNLELELVRASEEVQDLNNFVYLYIDYIKNACKLSIPIIKQNSMQDRLRTVSGWNSELNELRKLVNSKRRSYQRAFNNSTLGDSRKTDCFECKRIYCRKLKAAEVQSWKDFCTGIGSQPWTVLYKIVTGELRNQATLLTIKTLTGEYTSDLDETLNTLEDQFVPFDDVTVPITLTILS